MHKETKNILIGCAVLFCFIIALSPLWYSFLSATVNAFAKRISSLSNNPAEIQAAAWVIIFLYLFAWILPWLLQIFVTLYVFIRNTKQSEKALEDIKKSINSLNRHQSRKKRSKTKSK
jgi:beta-lactamase regulating signal transducer with metallopeptidase domain